MSRRAWAHLIWVVALFLGGLQSAGATSPLETAQADDVFLPFVASRQPTGIWTSAREVAGLPTRGPAWDYLMKWAGEDSSRPDLSDPVDDTDTVVVAKALVYARTGQERYRQDVIAAINAVQGTESGTLTLALGRNLTGYIIAADLVRLPADVDARFRSWLAAVRHARFDDRTLISTHEQRPNNWGTHAGAARIAAALYLGDSADLQRAAAVFRGWLGDRSAYAGFNFASDRSWQCDPQRPVPINPPGCVIAGHPVDGVLTEEQRRAGSFAWPPPQENYAWEALQGAVAQAWMLERAGYPAFSWQDAALLRAVTWLHEQAHFPAKGDDTGTPWLINGVYGTSFPTHSPARPGKNGLGFYEWLLGGR